MSKRIARLAACLLAALGAFCSPGAGRAGAAAFERPLSQLDYPTEEVSRPLTLARGWAEFSLRTGYQISESYFDSKGNEKDGTFDYRLWQFDLGVRYGWSRNLTLALTVPFLLKDFSNELGADISAWGLGDGSFSIRYQAWGVAVPLTSLAAELRLEFPSGSDSPGAVNNTSLNDLLFGRGIYSLHFIIMGKQALADWFAATGKIGYILRIPGSVEYVAGIHGESGHIDYGDEVVGELETIFQLPISIAPLAGFVLSHIASISYHGGTEAGVRDHLKPVPHTDGYFLKLNPAARLQVSANWDLVAEAEIPVLGKNSLAIFPIEATGNIYRLDLFFRF